MDAHNYTYLAIAVFNLVIAAYLKHIAGRFDNIKEWVKRNEADIKDIGIRVTELGEKVRDDERECQREMRLRMNTMEAMIIRNTTKLNGKKR